MEQMTAAQNAAIADFLGLGFMGPSLLRQAELTVHSVVVIEEGFQRGGYLANTSCRFSAISEPIDYQIRFGSRIKELVPFNEPFYGLLRGGEGCFAPFFTAAPALVLVAPLSVNQSAEC